MSATARQLAERDRQLIATQDATIAALCGLAGEAIPLSARIMAVADVYDALISRRVYKPAFSHDRAMQIIAHESVGHFDPDVVAVVLAEHDVFAAIARRFGD